MNGFGERTMGCVRRVKGSGIGYGDIVKTGKDQTKKAELQDRYFLLQKKTDRSRVQSKHYS